MYKIYFYKDSKGNQPVLQYLQELASKKGKDSRIKLNKINNYIQALSECGTTLGEPFIKHIDEEIWELIPLRDRIFFIAWHNNSYILLHCFIKKAQKTPKREIERAKREYLEIKKGNDDYE